MENRNQAESLAWDGWVGSQTPREFMNLSPGKSIEEAVAEYIEQLPSMYPGEASDIENYHPDYSLQELLEGYIRSDLPDDDVH